MTLSFFFCLSTDVSSLFSFSYRREREHFFFPSSSPRCALFQTKRAKTPRSTLPRSRTSSRGQALLILFFRLVRRTESFEGNEVVVSSDGFQRGGTSKNGIRLFKRTFSSFSFSFSHRHLDGSRVFFSRSQSTLTNFYLSGPTKKKRRNRQRRSKSTLIAVTTTTTNDDALRPKTSSPSKKKEKNEVSSRFPLAPGSRALRQARLQRYRSREAPPGGRRRRTGAA